MPRPRNASPSRKLHVALPGDVWPKLDLFLHSEVEQRIPFAAYQKFLVERVREFFNRASLDLALYFPEMPPGTIVYGPRAVIELLKTELESQ